MSILVHGDLADFLPADRRGQPITQRVTGHPSVKDVLEAAGIPHPELGAITVNGDPAAFRHRLHDGDRVEAFPRDLAAALALTPVLVPVPGDEEPPRFVVDGHLGRLAAYLRMLGFDTWYRTDADDGLLATVAAREGRILLTRDRGLLKRAVVRRGAFVRSDRPVEQLAETVRRFGLADRWQPFGRCLRCNTPLEPATRESVLHRLLPLTRTHYHEFRRCPGCDAVYWKGSHHARMTRLLDRIRPPAS